jgi:hypothetical protein
MGVIRLSGSALLPSLAEGSVVATAQGSFISYGNIAPANGAGARAITFLAPVVVPPAGRAVFVVYDGVTGADFTADYAAVLSAGSIIQQIGGNHAADSPIVVIASNPFEVI